MKLRISHYRNGTRTDEHSVERSLEDAQDHLCQLVRDGVVDRIEIRDSRNELIFNYPREQIA